NSVWTAVLPALLLSLVGAVLSAAIVGQGSGEQLQKLVAPLCGGEASCDGVLNSRWATFPPAPEKGADEAAAAAAPTGIPVGVLGSACFSFLAFWLLFVGRPSWETRNWHAVPTGVVILGSIGSVIFLFVMGFVHSEWCPLCIMTHLANFGVL